jgi:hypothetical protein
MIPAPLYCKLGALFMKTFADSGRRSRSSVRSGAGIVVTIVAAIVVASLPASAQRELRERSILVSATNNKDVPVEGLTPADFVVRENGVAREVIRVSPAPPPSHVVLLIDDSSVMQQAVSHLRDALPLFIGRMTELSPSPQIGLWTFGERPTKRADVSPNPEPAIAAAKKLFAITNAGGYLLQGIIEVSQDLRKKEAPQPVIVVFVNEGGVEFSGDVRTQVADALKRIGASLWSVALQQGAQPMGSQELRERAAVLGDVTADSGGMNKVILTQQSIDSGFTLVATLIKSRYLVTYGRPDSLVPPDKIEVTPKRSDVRMRSSKWTR